MTSAIDFFSDIHLCYFYTISILYFVILANAVFSITSINLLSLNLNIYCT